MKNISRLTAEITLCQIIEIDKRRLNVSKCQNIEVLTD